MNAIFKKYYKHVFQSICVLLLALEGVQQ